MRATICPGIGPVVESRQTGHFGDDRRGATIRGRDRPPGHDGKLGLDAVGADIVAHPAYVSNHALAGLVVEEDHAAPAKRQRVANTIRESDRQPNLDAGLHRVLGRAPKSLRRDADDLENLASHLDGSAGH